MSQSVVMIFKRDGSFLTTIDTVTEREWVKNQYGTCTFSLSLNDSKAIQRYLEFGNYIFIQHDSLPSWGGKILPDEDFNDNFSITVRAFSGERSLELRRTGWKEFITAGSAGTMFMALIARANKNEDLLIREGSVWRGGTPIERTFDGKSMYRHILDIAETRGNEWSIDAARDPVTNRLVFYANWYKKREATKVLVLKEGHNIKRRSSPLRVQRQIVNDLLAVGSGSDSTRPIAIKADAVSRARYGLMEGSVDISSSVQASVDAGGAAKLADLKNPRRTFQITALDVGETFKNLRLGNILPLQMQTVGFKDNLTLGTDCLVKIIGMRYRDDTNECDVNVDWVQDIERMRR